MTSADAAPLEWHPPSPLRGNGSLHPQLGVVREGLEVNSDVIEMEEAIDPATGEAVFQVPGATDKVAVRGGELVQVDNEAANASNIIMISSADFTVSLLGAVGASAPPPHPRRGLSRGTRPGRRTRVGQIP